MNGTFTCVVFNRATRTYPQQVPFLQWPRPVHQNCGSVTSQIIPGSLHFSQLSVSPFSWATISQFSLWWKQEQAFTLSHFQALLTAHHVPPRCTVLHWLIAVLRKKAQLDVASAHLFRLISQNAIKPHWPPFNAPEKPVIPSTSGGLHVLMHQVPLKMARVIVRL